MIERKIVQQNIKGFLVENYVRQTLTRVGHSKTSLARNPLGEKITIVASRPGLIVGSKGSNIKRLTKVLKAKFKLDNPQIEIEEVKNQNLDPRLVAENIASALERFGTSRFKAVGYKSLDFSTRAGALGIEILISGKIPSSRAKRWRFYKGYLKKCGDVSLENVLVAYDSAKLKTGVVGIQVRIMPPGVILPDTIELKPKLVTEIGEVGKDGALVSNEAEAIKAEVEAETDNVKEIKVKAAETKVEVKAEAPAEKKV
jgi:small subunit ribosomal protein S3